MVTKPSDFIHDRIYYMLLLLFCPYLCLYWATSWSTESIFANLRLPKSKFYYQLFTSFFREVQTRVSKELDLNLSKGT
jgi:hypothetical protein